MTIRGTHGDITNPCPPEDGQGNINSRIARPPYLAIEISKSVHFLAVDGKDEVIGLQAGLFCRTFGGNPGNENPAAGLFRVNPQPGL